MESTFLGIFHPRLKVETEAALKGQHTQGSDKLALFDTGQTSAMSMPPTAPRPLRPKLQKLKRTANFPEGLGKHAPQISMPCAHVGTAAKGIASGGTTAPVRTICHPSSPLDQDNGG
jgi:hypothetical protein